MAVLAILTAAGIGLLCWACCKVSGDEDERAGMK